MDGESVGTDAGTGMPLEAAPEAPKQPEAKPAEASNGAEPTEKKPPKPRTPDDDFEDLLKKTGGLKYKAKGAEKTVASVADLRRLLSSRDNESAALSQAAKERQEAAELKSGLAAVAKLPPRERFGALKALGIDPKLLREAAEDEILGEDERDKAQAHLTPREREYEAKLREREQENAALREEKEREQQAREQQAYVERVQQVGQKMEHVAVQALTRAKIAPEYLNQFLPAIARQLDRAERLGLDLDPEELADAVTQEQGKLADAYYGALDLPALSERLEAIQMDDPDKPGTPTTRLKLLMRHEAAKIRARQGGGQSPIRTSAPRPVAREMSMADKMDAARTFGGGGT